MIARMMSRMPMIEVMMKILTVVTMIDGILKKKTKKI